MSQEITVSICMGTGGIAAGAEQVMQAFRKELDQAGLTDVEITNRCSLHKVGCRGFCARDVLVDIIVGENTYTYQYVTEKMVEQLVKEHVVSGRPVAEWLVQDDYHNFHDNQEKIILSDLGKIDPESILEYQRVGGYQALQRVLSEMSSEMVVETVQMSGLRGRGGAGFPTGQKWRLTASVEAPQKYIICNADEGDPGAFMDRSIIEGNPHAVIEGMIIAGYATGADTGYIYIRAEYPLAVRRLRAAIKHAEELGYLGDAICKSAFSFHLKLKLGAGAFVCGEETALLASIEGKRGMPKPKPPYPAINGLWGCPTIINNVETFANIAPIISRGPEWFNSIGTKTSKGTKVIALTGRVKNTGLIEIPMGMSLKKIIYEIGGGIEGDRLFKAVQTGGPSGGCIPQQHIDLPVDYEGLKSVGSMMGSGGMVVLDETDCMVNIACFFLKFTMEESCGKCTPCRIGTKRLYEILSRITEGQGEKGDIEKLQELAEDIRDTSLCGLGMSAPNPVLSTLKYFRHEYEAHINEKRCPAGVCSKLLTYVIREDQCTGCTMCVKVCGVSAVSGSKKEPHVIDSARCIRCGACYDACKFSAIIRG